MNEVIALDPQGKYTRDKIKEFIEFNDKQLNLAEDEDLLVFFGPTMYGVYFFQFLKNYHDKFDQIRAGTYVPTKLKNKLTLT